MFYLYLVLLIYVNEAIYLLNLPFSKIHVNRFMAQDDSPGDTGISMYLVGEGPAAILWVLRHFLSLISRLLVAIWHLVKDQQGGNLSAPFWCLCQKLFYTLIKLCDTKALSDQALSLALDWILLLRRGQESRHLSWFSNNLSKQWSFQKMMIGDEYTHVYEWNGTCISNHIKINLPST